MALNTDNLDKCLQTLESSLRMLYTSQTGSTEYEVFRNATVKGFELTLEISGKLLKKSLRPFFESSKAVDKLTFKDLFRQGAKHGMLEIDEVERWFTYRDNRNPTAHDYGEAFAEKTLTMLENFIKDVKALLNRIKSDQT